MTVTVTVLMHCAVIIQLHYERDLGVPIDIIDPRNYILPKNPVPLPKEDEALLNWGDGDVPTNSAGESWVLL